MEGRSKTTIKLHAAQRYVVWHYLQPLFNNIRVQEFPKSGGTWLSQMIADVFAIPYPRNTRLPLGRCLQHEHYNSPLNYKTTILIRDGRDVITSAYFHFLIADHKRPKHLLEKWRRLMSIDQYDNVEQGMPEFIKVFNENFRIGGAHTTWSQHVMNANQAKESLVVKYEDLLKDTCTELKRISAWYNIEPKRPIEQIAEKFKFENVAKRSAGTEDRRSFLRKGIAGDWQNYFNEEAIEVFNDLHGDALRYFGYD